MRPSYEHIAVEGRSFNAFIREDSCFAFNWHYHSACELTLILESEGQRLVGNSIEDYGPGDLVLLGPNLPHSWSSSPEISPSPESTDGLWRKGASSKAQDKNTTKATSCVHRAVVVQFERDFLGGTLFETPEMQSVCCLLDNSAQGLAFGGTKCGRRVASTLAKLPEASPSRQLLLLLDLLQQLSEESEVQSLSSFDFNPQQRLYSEYRIDTVCTYVADYFDQPISQAKMAQEIGMNPAAFCRFFKQATGRTFIRYVNELRISRACRLLIETDLSVTQIGYRVGYSSHAHFNRQFQRLKGSSPGKFRRRCRP